MERQQGKGSNPNECQQISFDTGGLLATAGTHGQPLGALEAQHQSQELVGRRKVWGWGRKGRLEPPFSFSFSSASWSILACSARSRYQFRFLWHPEPSSVPPNRVRDQNIIFHRLTLSYSTNLWMLWQLIIKFVVLIIIIIIDSSVIV